MPMSNANEHSSSFSTRLEEQLSELSSSLIRPSSTYNTAQQAPEATGGEVNTGYSGGGTQSFLPRGPEQSAQKNNNSHQGVLTPKLPAMTEAPSSQSSKYNGDLLKSKRAAAMASLSQKRVSNSPSATGQIPQSTMTSKSANVSSPIKTEKSTASGPIASSADVDGLLAEVSAEVGGAADAKARKQNAAHHGDDSQSEYSRNGPFSSSSMRIPHHEKYAFDDTSRNFSYPHHGKNPTYKRSDEQQKSMSSSQGYPERRIYEPPRRSSATDMMSPARPPMSDDRSQPNTRDAKAYPTPSSRQDYNNEFAHMHPAELEELREWLAFTNYYDEAHRQKTLHRHRRLAAIEREKEELMREELDERDAYSHRDRALSNMPPPLARGSAAAENRLSSARRYPGQGYEDDLSANYGSRSTGSPALKRHYNESENHNSRPEKLIRTNSSDYTHERDPEGDFMNSARRQMLHHPSPHGDPTMEDRNSIWGSKGYRDSHSDSHNPRVPAIGEYYDDVQSHEYSQRGHWRGGRGRGGRGRGRGRGRGGYNADPDHGRLIGSSYAEDISDSGSIKLGVDNVRYFLVKSHSYENVEESQREGTWVTQLKNIETLAEAYDTCRHVILAFSVNQSKAFQGYARMDSAFGEKGIPTPSWASGLHWESSPPFRVRWLNKNETKFRYVGHLNNAFNENNTVLFGRDGQEIEPNCGMELCKLLDNPGHAPPERLGFDQFT